VNREEFLKKLSENLNHVSKEERDEILADFIEHFDQGSKEGKSDIEMIDQLGDVLEIASSYSTGQIKQYVKSSKDADWNSSFNNSNIKEIFVDTDISNVIIKELDISEIEVSVFSRDKEWIKDIETEISGDRLEINLHKKRKFKSIFGFGQSLGYIKTEVRIPKNQIKRIEVDTDTGSINLRDINTNYIELNTDTGNVDLKEIICDNIEMQSDVGKVNIIKMTAKKAEIETDAGGLDIRESIAGEWNISSDVGHVSVIDVIGKMNIDTDVGNILYSVDTIAAPVEIQSDVGKIDFAFCSGDCNIQADTDVGKVINEHRELILLNSSKGFVGASNSYAIGNRSNRVSLQTDVGKILIRNR